MSSMNKIYHGCVTRYADGMMLLIEFKNGKKCICATSDPYWKDLNTILEKFQGDKEFHKKEPIKEPIIKVPIKMKNLQNN